MNVKKFQPKVEDVRVGRILFAQPPRRALPPAKPTMRTPYRLSAEGRRVLAATIRRNRPWLRSTGPRTAEGKRRSSANSLKHGRRRSVVLRRIAGEAAVRDAIKASLDLDAATHRQPRAALHALRRIASASKRAVRHGDAGGFGVLMLKGLGPLADLGPDADLSQAAIDEVIGQPDSIRAWNRSQQRLVVALLEQVSSPGLNLGAIELFLRVDGVR